MDTPVAEAVRYGRKTVAMATVAQRVTPFPLLSNREWAIELIDLDGPALLGAEPGFSSYQQLK